MGLSKNSVLLLVGNPLSRNGYFYRACTQLSNWWTRKVPCSEVPELVDPNWLKEQADDHGADSVFYLSHLAAEFPPADPNSTFPPDALENSIGRDIKIDREQPRVMGIDPAGEGRDRCTWYHRHGDKQIGEGWWSGLGEREYAYRIRRLIVEEMKPEERPNLVIVEKDGAGTALYQALERLGLPDGVELFQVNMHEKPLREEDRELYADKRTWAAFQFRRSLIAGDVSFLPSYKRPKSGQTLLAELAEVRHVIQPGSGRQILERKDELRKRMGGKSPDLLDALLMSYAVDDARLNGAFGKRTPWKKGPIHRIIKGIV